MRFPESLPNDVVLCTWMEQGKGREANMPSASFVSPIWKHNPDIPRVVTLSLRPFPTTNLSLDSFMASHTPRRNCSIKQKFMLKPLELDQRAYSTDIHSTFGKDALGLSGASSSSKVRERIPLDENIKPCRPHSNCSHEKERRTSTSVVTLGDCSNASKQYVPDNLYNFKSNSFRPSPRLPQATGQRFPIANTFGFSYHAGYLNLLRQQAELVATGTPVTTIASPKPIQAKPALSKWQSRRLLNEKESKYPDPMLAASLSFQARMAEISQHELDTVKWERGKKTRKKNSSG